MTTFAKAFAAARKEKGAGATFTWNGKSYSTNRADDKPAASAKPSAQAPASSPKAAPRAGAVSKAAATATRTSKATSGSQGAMLAKNVANARYPTAAKPTTAPAAAKPSTSATTAKPAPKPTGKPRANATPTRPAGGTGPLGRLKALISGGGLSGRDARAKGKK